jgi:3-deoxy-D-manno-octulosonate 8-phosphate phosphatase (KDO 8-P phosphatase)
VTIARRQGDRVTRRQGDTVSDRTGERIGAEKTRQTGPGHLVTLSPCHLVTPTLATRCQSVELLLLDVDGVLTDGGIIYTDQHVELKSFHVRDGSGLKLWQRAGKRSAILTGRSSRVVDIRATELGIDRVIQGAADKLTAYRPLLAEMKLRPEQVCMVGDDIPDLPVLRNCGLAVAPADACLDVLADVHFVTQAGGGHGAVREAIELVLSCQGHWQRMLAGDRDAAL